MKNQTIYRRYVEDIMRELPLSEYTARFCDELLEHLEDCEENSANRMEADISQQSLCKIGSRGLLVQAYGEFHRKRRSKLRLLELAFYILFSWLMFFIISMVPNYFELTYLFSDYPAPSLAGVIFFCTAIFCALAVNYIFYNFLSVRLSLHLESADRRQKLLVLFFFLPAISALTGLMIAASDPEQNRLRGILIAPLPFLCAFLPALINFKVIGKDRKNTKLDGMLPYLTLSVFLVLLFSIALESQLPSSGIPQVLQMIVTVFNLFHFVLFALIDAIIDLPFFALFPIDDAISASYVAPVQMVSVNIAIAAAYVLPLGAIGVLALRGARKQKDLAAKRWNRAVGSMFCAYALFVFLPIKPIDAPAIDWKVPSREISKEIEKKQFGVFYHFIKFKNDDEGYIYNYDTCGIENGFIAAQSSGEIFNFDVTGAVSVSEVKTARMEKPRRKNYCAQTPASAYGAGSLFFFQEGWKCLDKNDVPLPMDRYEGCAKVTYRGREILREADENSIGQIRSIDMSADDNWALIKVADVYSVDFLYLIDLRKLK